jgi:hypothetical protein
MKSIIFLSLLICMAITPVSADKHNDLYISISLTISEHSRDSSSTQTTFTLKGNKIVYEETFGGYRANKRERVHKEHILTTQEISNLKRLIKEKNFLRSRSLTYPPDNAPSTHYDLTEEVRWQGKRSLIKVSGPIKSDEMKNSRLYEDADALLELVRAMINKG